MYSLSLHHSLVKSNKDVTSHPSCQVYLSLQIHLDTDHQGSILQLPISVDGALEKIPYSPAC